MNRLQAYISGWFAEPARWGESDCCLTCLDWVSLVRGGDLAEPFRYRYSDFAEAQRVTGFFTRPLPLCRERLEKTAGLAPVRVPQRGDVAVFKWPNTDGRIVPAGGICIAPGHFACRSAPGSPPGVTSARPRDLMGAWAVGYADA